MNPVKIIFKNRKDLRGELTVIDSEFDLPFDIKRVFYIKDIEGDDRGCHAHRTCEQILIPIKGNFTLVLDNGNNIIEYILDKSNEGVHIPIYHWIKMKNFSDDCIIMVICSYKYDENEYIRDYDVFMNEIN